MHRHWKIHRHLIEAPDALHRWDRAYQLLLRWGAAATPQAGSAASAASTNQQEVCDAAGHLRAGVHATASPDTDD